MLLCAGGRFAAALREGARIDATYGGGARRRGYQPSSNNQGAGKKKDKKGKKGKGKKG